jgi:hypothetical protein
MGAAPWAILREEEKEGCAWHKVLELSAPVRSPPLPSIGRKMQPANAGQH